MREWRRGEGKGGDRGEKNVYSSTCERFSHFGKEKKENEINDKESERISEGKGIGGESRKIKKEIMRFGKKAKIEKKGIWKWGER